MCSPETQPVYAVFNSFASLLYACSVAVQTHQEVCFACIPLVLLHRCNLSPHIKDEPDTSIGEASQTRSCSLLHNSFPCQHSLQAQTPLFCSAGVTGAFDTFRLHTVTKCVHKLQFQMEQCLLCVYKCSTLKPHSKDCIAKGIS